ncbi:hypothetical protein AB0M20_45425, partial [Actinoplanes sp. NPDC051633]
DLAPDTSLYARYPREVPLKHFRADLMDALGLPADDARDRRLSERLVLEALQTPPRPHRRRGAGSRTRRL